MQVLDPGQYEPAPAGMQELDPSEYEAVLPAKKRTGKVESFLRGAKQGATLGFGDEISGALESLFTSKNYTQARDEARANDKAAQESNPWTYGAGGVTGGLATAVIPGGAAVRGALGAGKLLAGAGAAAKTGAALGAAGGLGASEADLTKGEFGGAAADTAVGAGLGALAGAGGQVASNLVGKVASERAARYAGEKLRAAQAEGKDAFKASAEKLGSLVAKDKPAALAAVKSATAAGDEAKRQVTDDALAVLRGPGAQNSTKTKVLGADIGLKKVRSVLDADRELRSAIMESPDKALDVIGARLAKYGDKLDDVYKAGQALTPGVRIDKVMLPLHKLEQEYAKNTATRPLAEQVAKEIEQVRGAYQQTNVVGGVGRIPLQRLREEYRAWQDIAYQSVKMTGEKSPRAQVAEEMSQVMRKALHDEIERVATATPASGPLLKSLQIANEKVSAYKGVQRILDEQQRRLNAGAPTLTKQLGGIKDQIREGMAGMANRALDPMAAAVARTGQRIQANGGAPARAGMAALPYLRRSAAAGAPQAPGTAAAALRQALGLGPEDDEEQQARPQYAAR